MIYTIGLMNKEGEGKMDMNEIRNTWEMGLSVLTEHTPRNGVLLVMLKDEKEYYHLHRYFLLGNSWNVSVDVQGVDADSLIKAIFKVI